MEYDIAIIGAGPGGYVSAIKASQLGAKVALIEKEALGGICLNWGCIPTKTILSSSEKYALASKFKTFGINIENLSFDYSKIYERKNLVVDKIGKGLTQLIKSYNIDVFDGNAIIKDKNTLLIENTDTQINFKNLIIATGSRPMSLPNLSIDHKFILDTNDILSLKELPESLMIIGSGANGIEWARILSSFGKKVILVELAERLMPMMDSSISERIERIFKRKRIEFYTKTNVEKINGKKVLLNNGKEFEPDKIFLAAGRIPNSDIAGIEEIGILKNKNYIIVNENLKTNIPNIYAIGDVTGLLPLAHTASHQGICVIEHILLSKNHNIDYNAIPKVIYGKPEIASVGLTESQLIEQNISYKTSIFPMSAIGKSLVDDEIEGFVKVLASEDKIFGVHIVAENADMMIQQAAIAINNNLKPEDLENTVFAHPTLSEALHESFLGINGYPIHLPKLKVNQ